MKMKRGIGGRIDVMSAPVSGSLAESLTGCCSTEPSFVVVLYSAVAIEQSLFW